MWFMRCKLLEMSARFCSLERRDLNEPHDCDAIPRVHLISRFTLCILPFVMSLIARRAIAQAAPRYVV